MYETPLVFRILGEEAAERAAKAQAQACADGGAALHFAYGAGSGSAARPVRNVVVVFAVRAHFTSAKGQCRGHSAAVSTRILG